jgi:4-amino-4-deoxy-L-arabinose transferase-like glycosyltransferase
MNNANADWEKFPHSVLLGALLIFGYFFLMFGNGAVSLTHPDEVFYIQSAKEMLKHQSWFTPIIFDAVQFEKPFLAFVLFMASIKMFGLNPGAARFFPALFAVIGLPAAYAIAWLLFGKKRLAFLSGIVLGSSFIYMALARAVLTDMIFSVFVLLAILSFTWAYFRPRFRDFGIYGAYFFAGMAVLTKGLLGICFPGAVALLFLIYRQDFAFFRRGSIFSGALLFLAIAVPWHVAMWRQHGDFFLYEYFGNVHIRRLMEAEHPKINTWYFYPGLMFAGVMPWSLFWLPAIGSAVRTFKQKTKACDGLAFLFLWMFGILAFVQPAASKLASYVFPAFPAIAILIAFTLDQALDAAEGRGEFVIKGIGFVMATIVSAIAIAGIFAGKHYIVFLGTMHPVYKAVFAALLVAIIIFQFGLRKQFLSMILSLSAISALLLCIFSIARPLIEPWVSCEEISNKFKAIDQTDSSVLTSKFYVRGIRYYTDRPMAVVDINGEGFWSPHEVPFLTTDAQVADFLRQRPVSYAIVKQSNVEDLERIARAQTFKFEKLDGLGGKYILRITRPDP